MKKSIIAGIITLIILSIGTLLIISHNRNLGTTSSEIGGTLAIIVYDESLSDYVKQDIIPKENYKLNRTKTHCTANRKIKSYDSANGTITYSLTTADQCYVYFDTLQPYDILSGSNLAQTIVTLGTSNTMAMDSSWGIINENGYRYEGKNPDNYICFGSEETTCPEDSLYRIIGAFETEYDADGDGIAESTGYLTKIQKYTMYGGTSTVYHSNASGTTNSHYPNSEIYLELNTNWYGGLDSGYQNQVANVNWHLGAAAQEYSLLTAFDFYTQERGTTVNTGITENEKVFKIGMMYPSDYGYSVLSDNCNRTTPLTDYDITESCFESNWMASNMVIRQWTMTPRLIASISRTFLIGAAGKVGALSQVNVIGEMRPVFYLNFDIVVTEGYGIYEEPYRISL